METYREVMSYDQKNNLKTFKILNDSIELKRIDDTYKNFPSLKSILGTYLNLLIFIDRHGLL